MQDLQAENNIEKMQAKMIKGIPLHSAKLRCATPHYRMMLALRGYTISENDSTNSWKTHPIMPPAIQTVLELEDLQAYENISGKLLAHLPTTDRLPLSETGARGRQTLTSTLT